MLTFGAMIFGKLTLFSVTQGRHWSKNLQGRNSKHSSPSPLKKAIRLKVVKKKNRQVLYACHKNANEILQHMKYWSSMNILQTKKNYDSFFTLLNALASFDLIEPKRSGLSLDAHEKFEFQKKKV